MKISRVQALLIQNTKKNNFVILEKGMELKKAIVNTLQYSDIFDFPLRAIEIHQRLLFKNSSLKSLVSSLKNIPGVKEKDGYYFLGRRHPIVGTRLKREQISTEKISKVRFGLTLLRFVPWIKLVAVTGSVAAKNALKEDDIDLFIITSRNRLWVSRLLATVVLDIFGLRRKKGDSAVRNKLCLNMFLAGDKLNLEKDLYTAYEIVQLKPIWWKGNTYYQFVTENSWVKRFLPNYRFPKKKRFSIPTSMIALPFLKRFESWLFKIQRESMQIRGNEKVTENEIRFHPLNTKLWILNEFYLRTNLK